MRRIEGQFNGLPGRRPYRVVNFDRLHTEWTPELNFLVANPTSEQFSCLGALQVRGLSNIASVTAIGLEHADVVVPDPQRNDLIVPIRASDRHHSVFLTNRCNSNCLMCSQPPTTHDDGWLVDEALAILAHALPTPTVLGVTGGEPLLLRDRLVTFLNRASELCPNTQFEVLTNGRLFADEKLCERLTWSRTNTRWLIPLYGAVDYLHDFVVQAEGAFDQTIAGLLNLQQNQQAIQLRIVLIRPVLENLVELCDFVGRNLPFVSEVALMACEPTGFAMANKSLVWASLEEWDATLRAAVDALERHRLRHLFMNVPLCLLPETLRAKAAQSISDWKNIYGQECTFCTVRERCTGLFASTGKGWLPGRIKAIAGEPA